MQRNSSLVPFLLLVAVAGFFVWATSRSLPDVVASHFVASGIANGFMPRAFYVRFMLVFVVGLPLILLLLTNVTFTAASSRINLPHREYWLAPKQREETIAYLRRHTTIFGGMLVVFLSYVHWLVVQANNAVPPRLPSFWFIGGLVAFVASAILWIIALYKRFRTAPH
jgi:uncharacterized membrane protein